LFCEICVAEALTRPKHAVDDPVAKVTVDIFAQEPA